MLDLDWIVYGIDYNRFWYKNGSGWLKVYKKEKI